MVSQLLFLNPVATVCIKVINLNVYGSDIL